MRTVSRWCVPIAFIAILSLFVLPFRGVANAAPTASGPFGEFATNPLILTDKATGAQVQMMPTRQWLAQHQTTTTVSNVTSSVSPGSPASGGLSPSTCTLGTDNSAGDAHVLVNSSEAQFDSLDISAFGLASDSTNITGELSVVSLSNGTPVSGTPAPATPAVAGGGDAWYVIWNYGNDPTIKGYFLEAMYPGD